MNSLGYMGFRAQRAPCLFVPRRGCNPWSATSSHALLSFCLEEDGRSVGRPARRDAGAWSVLEILGVSGDLLVVFRAS